MNATRRSPARRPRPAPRRRRIDPARQSGRAKLRYPLVTADLALHNLMEDADLYRVGRSIYLVAPVDARIVDTLIAAMGSTEDDEDGDPGGGNADDAGFGELDNCDDEPSTGSWDDLEHDGGWQNEGSQLSLHCSPYGGCDAEPDLGWSNTGSQLKLVTADEGDGDCDREDDDPGGDPLDKGELDPCDEGEPEESDCSVYDDHSPIQMTGADTRLIAAAKERWRAQQPSEWTDPMGTLFHVSFEPVSGCRVLTPAVPGDLGVYSRGRVESLLGRFIPSR
jgi:hypothetical protein